MGFLEKHSKSTPASSDLAGNVEEYLRELREDRIINSEAAETGLSAEQTKIRKAGVYKGQIRMSDDFDGPLNEFKEYM